MTPKLCSVPDKARIHPTAIVSPKAVIGEGVEIGPYCVVGPLVKIGNGTRLMSHVVLEGHTTIGRGCEIFHGACLGAKPQDKKYRDGESFLEIGDENVIREYVTIHPGTAPGNKTVIGDRNFFMVASHVGHDCRVGNEVTLANESALSGHVVIEDQVVIGGISGVHQFCRVGRLAMVGAMSKVVMDVLPFSVCDGHPAKFCGLNSVGLKRAGYTSKEMLDIKKALKILVATGTKLSTAMDVIRATMKGNAAAQTLVRFCEAAKRGVCRGAFQKGDT